MNQRCCPIQHNFSPFIKAQIVTNKSVFSPSIAFVQSKICDGIDKTDSPPLHHKLLILHNDRMFDISRNFPVLAQAS